MGGVLRIRRSIVLAAMERACVQNASIVAKQMYARLGRDAVDLLWVAGRSKRARDGVRISADVALALDDALAGGPVIFFASHTGNWELTAAAAARLLEARGKKLVVVAKPMSDRGTDSFLARLRASLGVTTIAPHGALRSASYALASREAVVVMPIDQVPDDASHGMQVSFLGAPALVDRAPATLAWRSRATALVVATDSLGCVHLLSTLRPSSGSSRVWINDATVNATSALAAFIEKEPAAWLWLHRRWKGVWRRTHGALLT